MMAWLRKHKNLVSNAALVLTLIVGLSYVSVSALQFNPLRSTFVVTVELAGSGGLQQGSNVSLRGLRIGNVEDVRITSNGVEAVLRIDERHRIPAMTHVAVRSLSAAGEQYIDFRPPIADGPALTDGDVVPSTQSEIPVSFASMLGNVTNTIGQIDPEKLNVIVDELHAAADGRADRFHVLADSAYILIADLHDVLPETTELIRSARTVLATIGDLEGSLSGIGDAGVVLASEFAAADAELRALFDEAPGTLDYSRQQIAANRDVGGDVLKMLGRIGASAELRTPAIEALFPNLRKGGGAFGLASRGGQFNILGDIYPRRSCDYLNPTTSPAFAATTPPLRYMYCTTDDPSLQIRGAQNAPRPDGDDTYGPPPGVTGQERTSTR